MNEDVILAFMIPLTVLGCVVGYPLVRALAKRWERQAAIRPAPVSDERLLKWSASARDSGSSHASSRNARRRHCRRAVPMQLIPDRLGANRQ